MSQQQARKEYVKNISIIGAFFFIFGFISWVNGTLIPYLRIACELKEWQAYLVTFAFYISYTVMATPASKILQRSGMLKGMSIGLTVMALGCGCFIPAALTRNYALFLIGLFIVGAGLTLLQTAVNPYITLLGPASSAARRISIMGVCNKVAGILAPLVMGTFILRNASSLLTELAQLTPEGKQLRLDQLSHAVITPYCALTIILLLIAILIRYAHLPEIGATSPAESAASAESEESSASAASSASAESSASSTSSIAAPASSAVPAAPSSSPAASAASPSSSVPSYRSALIKGFIAIFFAVGVEVMAGDTIGGYGLYHKIDLDIAKNLTSWTLTAMMLGYLVGIWAIPKYISQQRVFAASTIYGLCMTALILVLPGKASIAALALLGFGNAILWPAIWPQALSGLQGTALARASAILIMGIAGGALMPLCYGWLATAMNNRLAYLIFFPAYLYMLYYSILGLRLKK